MGPAAPPPGPGYQGASIPAYGSGYGQPYGPQHPGPAYGPVPGPAGYPTAAQPVGYPPVEAPRRSGAGRLSLAVIVLLIVALAGGVGGAVIALHNRPADNSGTVQVSAPVSNAKAPTQSLAKVAAAIQPSVVSITVRGQQQSDEGSGVVLTAAGLIVTNNHVIAAASDGAGTIRVTFSNGKSASASIVGRDPSGDLAVIRANNVSGLQPATFGSSDNLHVGDTVLAIGSPLGLDGSVTSGIVSALHRSVRTSEGGQTTQGTTSIIDDAIQTDAAVNPGNSGGPLVNLSGQVVGINSAIASLGSSGATGQSGSIGVGFAIPSTAVQKDIPLLQQGKTPQHAVLGVQVTDSQHGGALLDGITRGGAAAAAGLRAGDVITKLGSTSITGADQLGAAVRNHSPGDKVSVTFTRGGAERTIQVTLGGGT